MQNENAGDRKGKFIAVANMKGGVGKTTTVVSLAEALAADDLSASVLVVDLDPQASASLCLAGDDLLADLIEEGRTLQDFLGRRLIKEKKKESIDKFIRRSATRVLHQGEPLNISLLPCGPQLRLLEREIIYKLTRDGLSMDAIEGHLWKLFTADFVPLRHAYDYVVFDCPPSISPLSEVAIHASDVVIVPTIPDRISNFGLNAFCFGVWKGQLSSLPSPPKPYVLISRMQEHVKQHQTMALRLEAEAKVADAAFHLLSARIPQSAALAKALGADGAQSFTKKYSLSVAQMLAPLAAEIKELLNADRH